METPPELPPSQSAPQPSERLGDDAKMRALIPVGKTGWAIAAGYLGLASVFVIPAPFAVIVSIIAIVDIQKSKGIDNKKRGMGRAVFGLIMGLFFSILFVLWGVSLSHNISQGFR